MGNKYADAEIPAGSSNYMRLNKEEQTFRILDDPIMGTEGWKDKKPVRVRMGEAISVEDVDDPAEIKYFWAMPVWNYEEEKVQILEITQKSILRAIQSYARDEDYGDPKGYDIKVSGSGEGLERRYLVTPKPPKKLDPAFQAVYDEMDLNLEVLFDNGDPFKDKPDLDIDEVSKEIS